MTPIETDVPTSRGPERRGWHIDKTISVSDLISMVLVVVPAIWWAGTVESRFAVADEWRATTAAQRAEDRATTDRTLTDLQNQLRTMDARMADKLDRIFDKVGAR
jgi:hypothetical protein